MVKPGAARKGFHLLAVWAALMLAANADAQTSVGSGFTNPYAGFFEPAVPGRFALTIFTGGYTSDPFKTLQEGFEFNQSLTPYIGIVGRATGYQLFVGKGFQNPLIPDSGSRPRYNFGRFQGGIDFAVTPNTHVFILGGGDAADSHRANIEGDFASWMFVHSLHPVNLMITAIHDYQNGVTSSSIDLRTVILSTEDYMLVAGGGGAIYGGGFLSGVAGEGGPDLGIYYRRWGVGIDGQGGYGTSRGYGQLTIYKTFGWTE